ncbi:MAG: hypothetical protein HC927_00165 [Deltaproteobacteria bacterium]|nr:hypothetical protein [Deltaproteobacteria bacterium]
MALVSAVGADAAATHAAQAAISAAVSLSTGLLYTPPGIVDLVASWSLVSSVTASAPVQHRAEASMALVSGLAAASTYDAAISASLALELELGAGIVVLGDQEVEIAALLGMQAALQGRVEYYPGAIPREDDVLATGMMRALAIEDVVQTLTQETAIPTVIDGFLDVELIQGYRRPIVGVYASVPQPAPIEDTFGGSYREDIDLVLWGAVDADSPLEGRLGLARLERDCFEALFVDRRRGGWAFDTRKVGGTSTDEATLRREGKYGGLARFALFSTTMRVSYYPEEQGDERSVAHCDLYLASPATVSVTQVAAPTELAVGTLTIGNVLQWEPGPSGRARYTGTRVRTHLVEANFSLSQDPLSQAPISLFLALDGVAVARTEMRTILPDDELRQYALRAVLDLPRESEISVAIQPAETGLVTVSSLQITALPKLA